MSAVKTPKVALFPEAEVLKDWGDGYVLVELKSPQDLDTLGKHGGGCSANHWHWTTCVSPQCEYFLVMMHQEKVGVILFCKDQRWRGQKHPQDGKKLASCTKLGKLYPNGWGYGYGAVCNGDVGGSDYYDRGWSVDTISHYGYSDAHYLEQNLREAQARYENVKKKALVHGKLGPDNPLKYDVDLANKRVTACKGAIERQALRDLLGTGTRFMYRGAELFVLQQVGRYSDGMAANTRYTKRFLEWMEEQKEAALVEFA